MCVCLQVPQSKSNTEEHTSHGQVYRKGERLAVEDERRRAGDEEENVTVEPLYFDVSSKKYLYNCLH